MKQRKGEGFDQFGTPPFFLKYGGENNMLLNIMPKEWSGEQALHSAAQATRDGNILDLKGMCGTLVLQVTGTFSGTIVPKVSNDNVNYVERLAIDGKTGASLYSITAPGIYTIDVVGIKKFKAEITAFTAGSGSITVTALGLPITSGMGSGAANLINNIINGTAPATVTISDSNVEAINGEDAATKSDLVAGKTVGGKQVPLKVDSDGKLQVGGITVDSVTATIVGIDQETENANEVVVKSGSITLTGSIESLTTAPVVGVKTVTATAAEIFAGSSAKANRRKLVVKNEDKILRFRIGADSVTQQNGFPVEPGAIVEIQFDPGTAVAIYGISEGASLSAAVMEV